jgi:hypothetical protein
MSANSIGSTSRSDPEWDAAQHFFEGLVGVSRDHLPIAIVEPAEASTIASTDSIEDNLEPDQFTRDIAEIERAAAALQAGQPDLEPWTSGATVVREQRKPRSVWLFVGTIWIVTVLVTGAATLAITALL